MPNLLTWGCYSTVLWLLHCFPRSWWRKTTCSFSNGLLLYVFLFPPSNAPQFSNLDGCWVLKPKSNSASHVRVWMNLDPEVTVVHHAHDIPSDGGRLAILWRVPGSQKNLFTACEVKCLNAEIPKYPAPVFAIRVGFLKAMDCCLTPSLAIVQGHLHTDYFATATYNYTSGEWSKSHTEHVNWGATLFVLVHCALLLNQIQWTNNNAHSWSCCNFVAPLLVLHCWLLGSCMFL